MSNFKKHIKTVQNNCIIKIIKNSITSHSSIFLLLLIPWLARIGIYWEILFRSRFPILLFFLFVEISRSFKGFVRIHINIKDQFWIKIRLKISLLFGLGWRSILTLFPSSKSVCAFFCSLYSFCSWHYLCFYLCPENTALLSFSLSFNKTIIRAFYIIKHMRPFGPVHL